MSLKLPLYLLLLFGTAGLVGQVPPADVNTVFPAGQMISGGNFTGTAWVERLLVVDDEQRPVAVGNVTFAPKARSNWHHHPAGQSLLALDGLGYYQERGGPVRLLRKGETVQCPPGVEHWHGAANSQWFVQLAMTKEHPDGRVIWGEPVTEEEYHQGIAVERATTDSLQTINDRYRHIATVASLTTLGELERLQAALGDALDAGLTVNECKEVLVHLYAYTGFPRSIQGLRTLMAAVEDRQSRGIQDETGPEAGEVNDSVSRYERGRATLEELIGRPVEGRSDYGDFAPVIDVFLKEHLFADIFGRDVLSYHEREIATISALSSLDGVAPMLRGHLGIALNLGITAEQLSEVLRQIDYTAGPAAAGAAREVLREVVGL
ncbi:quercetin dioxygenase-like cupin family protein [Lewinella marina]|uniref:4-carboxymuconolactone decarboxylase n=1 Tax=Neolewinella marina TaxID=438751 RepID=A0A2G0CK86_9BACT|nr:carboxymuconolactone decarboxylase family protein [Neolewinella marina]NJB84467.1 quercetin dioxygenase-like cupin family protein [Neolewinella marina]PHL00341.1 4-carboxymuconolactone decarboxylase [Neolewinella marina]